MATKKKTAKKATKKTATKRTRRTFGSPAVHIALIHASCQKMTKSRKDGHLKPPMFVVTRYDGDTLTLTCPRCGEQIVLIGGIGTA